MESGVKGYHTYRMDDHENVAQQQRLAIVKYQYPEDITSDQYEILKVMILNRIESVITGENFNRNTLLMVKTYMEVPSWWSNHNKEEEFYLHEANEIDEMFTDIEADKAYEGTIRGLAGMDVQYFQIKEITDTNFYIMLSL